MLNLISDLDEFLYPRNVSFGAIKNQAAAQAAIYDCGFDCDVATVIDLILRGMAEKNDWMAYLVEAGIDADAFHDFYHRRLDHSPISRYPGLVDSFTALGQQAAHVLLTHGSTDWAVRTVEHLGLRRWYPDERIIAWEKYRAHKHLSQKGFEMAASLLGVEPRDIHFGDDNLPNLMMAKSMGMRTIWVSHGKALPQGMAQYVDEMAGNVYLFLQQYIARMPRMVVKPQAFTL